MGKRVQHWNAYEGSCVKLIICIDIGTTNSGASYAFLEPGKPPKVFDTGAFPKSTRGSYKAPSVVAYDTNGKCVAVGSEVDEDMHNAEAEQALFVAKWWKLALTTSNIPTCVDLSTHIELPAGVSAEDCLIRYLAWMWQCVKTDIRSRYTQGDDLLRLTEASMELILTHPNTWDGRAQKAMRSAAVQAGVVSAHSAEQAVRFLTEAEASLTYAVLHSTMQSWVQPGKSLVIADLGGGTCDFSTYDIVQTQPLLQIRESAIARCVVGGATTVQKRAQQLLRQRLQHTLWESEIDWLAGKLWEIIAKLYPRSDGGVFLKVGSKTQTDESRNIICGKLYFTSAEITALFEPSLCSITDALRAALAASGSSDQKVVLVGGFAENEFLRHRIKEEMGSDVSLVKADNLLAKAVANGGCSWGIQSVVSMRMSAVSYGVRCAVPYLPASPEHRAREGQAIVHSDGIKRVANGYWEILPAESVRPADEECSRDFAISAPAGQPLTGNFDLLVYRLGHKAPPFIDHTSFEKLCTLKVDLTKIMSGIETRVDAAGKRYKSANVQIKLRLTDTELKARWIWKQGSIPFEGAVQSIYADTLPLFVRKAATPYSGAQDPTAAIITSDTTISGISATHTPAQRLPSAVTLAAQAVQMRHPPGNDQVFAQPHAMAPPTTPSTLFSPTSIGGTHAPGHHHYASQPNQIFPGHFSPSTSFCPIPQGPQSYAPSSPAGPTFAPAGTKTHHPAHGHTLPLSTALSGADHGEVYHVPSDPNSSVGFIPFPQANVLRRVHQSSSSGISMPAFYDAHCEAGVATQDLPPYSP